MIQEVIDNLPDSGGLADLPPGDYELSSTLVLGDATASLRSSRNGITLSGTGRGADIVNMGTAGPSGATRLIWTGPPGGTMIKINGPVSGITLKNLVLDGNGSASTLIHAVRAFNLKVTDVMGMRWQGGYAVRIDADSVFNGNGQGGANAPLQHVWENVYITDPSGDPSQAHGLQISTNVNGVSNCNELSFIRCQFERGDHDDAVGVWLGNVDHCAFFHCFILRRGSTQGKGIVVAPQVGAPQRPSNITFLASPIIGGIFHDTSAATWNNARNPALIFYPYYGADSQQTPPLGALNTTLPHRMVGGITDRGTVLGNRESASMLQDSTPIANTTTQTAFDKTLVVDSVMLNRSGAVLEIEAGGTYSSSGIATIDLALEMSGVVLFSSLLATANSANNFGWSLRASVLVKTPGAMAQLQRGPAYFAMGSFNVVGETPPNGGALSTDLSTDQTVSVKAGWTTASPSNSITLQYIRAKVTQSEVK